MSKLRNVRRRPRFQSLDRRFVMDAEGVELDLEMGLPREDSVEVDIVKDDDSVIEITVSEGGMDVTDDGELSHEIFQTMTATGGDTESTGDGTDAPDLVRESAIQTFSAFDVNASGSVTPLDALVIINSVGRRQRASFAAATAEGGANSGLLARAAETNSRLDVNRDTLVSSRDALLVLNSLARINRSHVAASRSIAIDEPTDDEPSGDGIVIDKPFESSEDGVLELALADVGPYAVVSLQIDDDGLLTGEANGEVVDVAVGTDGSLSIGDVVLPAHLVTSSVGSAGLLPGYVESNEESPVEGFVPVGIARPQLNTQALLDAACETAKSLDLTDVDTFGVVHLELDSDGMLSATADGNSIEASVEKDGSIRLGDFVIPARMYTTVAGVSGLFAADDPLLMNAGGEDLPPFDPWFEGETGDDSVESSERFAGALSLTIDGIGEYPIVLSVTEDQAVVATSQGESLNVVVGKDGSVSIGDESIPVRVLNLNEQVYLVPTSDGGDDVVVSWTVAVDDAMAQWA